MLTAIFVISAAIAGCSSEEADPASGQATAATRQTAEQPSSTAGQTQARPTPTFQIIHIEVDYEAGIEQVETLVTLVDDTFIGTVLAAGRAYPGEHSINYLKTPFTVEVDQRLLGDVSGTVMVIQLGGFDPDRNVLVDFGSDPLIEVGETYLFLTRSTGRNDPPEPEEKHAVVPFLGHTEITSDAHRQRLIQEYTEAINEAGLGS